MAHAAAWHRAAGLVLHQHLVWDACPAVRLESGRVSDGLGNDDF